MLHRLQFSEIKKGQKFHFIGTLNLIVLYPTVISVDKRKLARLITQYRDIFFQYLGRHGTLDARSLLARQRAAKGEKKLLAPRVKARPSFFGVLQRMTKVFNVTR